MFTWLRRCCRCKIILPILSAASITLFSIVPFSASAAKSKDIYLLDTTNIFSAFPYHLTTTEVGQAYNKLYLYENDNFHHNNTYYKEYDLQTNNVALGQQSFPWNCYYNFTDFRCKSATAIFALAPLNFTSDESYVFNFTFKVSKANKVISNGSFFDHMNLEFINNHSTVKYTPSQIFSDDYYYYLRFAFTIQGSYLDSASERVVKMYFSSPESVDGDFILTLYPDDGFSIRIPFEEEEDPEENAQLSADAIAGIGSNIPPVDMSGSTSNMQDLTDLATDIDEEYSIDTESTSATLNQSSAIFSQRDFVLAADVIESWFNLFLSSSNAIYSMIICSLGLGIAFYAIGRM